MNEKVNLTLFCLTKKRKILKIFPFLASVLFICLMIFNLMIFTFLPINYKNYVTFCLIKFNFIKIKKKYNFSYFFLF
jgi:hypothetical protein